MQLAALFERNGYVRLQNAERFAAEGSQKYKKGSEVRLVAESRAELARMRKLLAIVGFTPGRAYAKGRQFCLPIYGREQTAEFTALVAKHTTQRAPAKR